MESCETVRDRICLSALLSSQRLSSEKKVKRAGGLNGLLNC